MITKRFILLLSFLLISKFLFGKAPDTLLFNKVLAQLMIKQSEVNLELSVIKILPYVKDKTVIVIPKYVINKKDEYENYYFELDAYIIIANTITGKILYKFYEPNAWVSDAIMLTSIEIDTGLYQLNNETRAFGVRVNYTGSSKPNPFHQTDLSLYIFEKNILKPVLKNFSIATFNGEWDMKCAGEFTDVTSVIIIGKSNSKNLNNLILKTKIVQIKNVSIEGDCIENKKSKISIKLLRYNGVEYQ